MIALRTTTLALCATVTFVAVLVLYAVVSGRSPVARLGYAVFVSVTPALLAWSISWLLRQPLPQTGTVLLYAVLFFLIVLVQGLI